MHGNEPAIPPPDPASAGWPPPAPPSPDGGRPRRFGRVPMIAGAVVASFFLVGLGVAYAQSESSSTTATTLPAIVPPPAGQIAPATPARPAPNAKGER
ncbi:MAG: hypothetical protein ACRDYF_20075, partial [Acidimicrobiia bacterium]